MIYCSIAEIGVNQLLLSCKKLSILYACISVSDVNLTKADLGKLTKENLAYSHFPWSGEPDFQTEEDAPTSLLNSLTSTWDWSPDM